MITVLILPIISIPYTVYHEQHIVIHKNCIKSIQQKVKVNLYIYTKPRSVWYLYIQDKQIPNMVLALTILKVKV